VRWVYLRRRRKWVRLTSKGSKLVAVVLVAIVVASGLGYWLFVPNTSSQIPATTEQTSLLTPQRTYESSTTSQTLTSSTSVWLNVSATKPVSYYLSLLESNGTQPYVQLARELRRLPDLKNETAVAMITYLALNATNPEVKEAFDLMIKGGTPDPRDFTYAVPNYDTELQVLYWLALQNEFKKDDTLALAIAMVNGLWVTMGDGQVREAVNRDASDLLAFFRETNEIQRSKGYFQLEDYPLEAKTCLAYTSSIGTYDGPHSISRLVEKHADLRHYNWVRYDVGLLRKMREIAFEKSWVERSTDSTVKNLEEYFYFSGAAQHWTYSTRTGDIPGVTESLVEVEGELVPDHSIYNLHFYLDQYLTTGKGLGDCGDETYFMEAWSKSLGIATNFVLHQIIVDGKYYGHAHMIYYEPLTKTWKAYEKQPPTEPDVSYYVFIFRPPVRLAGYFAFSPIKDSRMGMSGTVYVTRYTPVEFRGAFLSGLPSSQMKQWLLYG
jgi:hypothetical protein